MSILDENIIFDQREQLKKWKPSLKQIGYDIGRPGLKDYEIIPFLLQLRKATFLTRDRDFNKHGLCHNKYCLAWLEVSAVDFAFFARRFLQQKEFSTQSKRMGL